MNTTATTLQAPWWRRLRRPPRLNLALQGGGAHGAFAWDVLDALLEDPRLGIEMRTKARKEVDEAVDAMKKRGLVVNRPTPDQMKEWNELADKLYPRIRGTMVPADTIDEVFGHLNSYRDGQGKVR